MANEIDQAELPGLRAAWAGGAACSLSLREVVQEASEVYGVPKESTSLGLQLQQLTLAQSPGPRSLPVRTTSGWRKRGGWSCRRRPVGEQRRADARSGAPLPPPKSVTLSPPNSGPGSIRRGQGEAKGGCCEERKKVACASTPRAKSAKNA